MSDTPEQRRRAQIRSMAPGVGSKGLHLNDTDAAHRLDDLLGHFEDSGQQAVADAIRYGAEEWSLPNATARPYLVRINYPEGHKKR